MTGARLREQYWSFFLAHMVLRHWENLMPSRRNRRSCRAVEPMRNVAGDHFGSNATRLAKARRRSRRQLSPTADAASGTVTAGMCQDRS